jgi:hypothetical protein
METFVYQNPQRLDTQLRLGPWKTPENRGILSYPNLVQESSDVVKKSDFPSFRVISVPQKVSTRWCPL